MPTSGKAAASTALPQPPSTSQNVPMNSAKQRFDIGIAISLLVLPPPPPYAAPPAHAI